MSLPLQKRRKLSESFATKELKRSRSGVAEPVMERVTNWLRATQSDTVTRSRHPALQHHFENMEQQREASTLGMWVFLVTEIMFFGGMFLAYTLYRYKYPEAFASASNHLDLKLGAINTVVLILSSFTMAMAVYSTQVGKRRNQIISLA